MLELVRQREEDQEPITTTRIIAENFKKRHDNVLKKVGQVITEHNQEFSLLHFKETSYQDSQNKTQIEYEITETGFMLLAMSFTGRKAADARRKFAEAFLAMRKKLKELIKKDEDLPVEVQALIRVTREAMEAKKIAQDNKAELKLLREDMEHKETYRTIQGFAADKKFQIPRRVAQSWGKQATKLSKERNIEIGRVTSEKYGSINSYQVDILEEVWLNYITE